MDPLHRRKFFFLIALSLGFVAFTWGVLIPAGGQDHRGHPPGIAHPHRHDPRGPVSDTNGAPPILFTPGQAEEVTLRFARVERHRIEKWIRTAGKRSSAKQALEGRVFGPEARLIQREQQVRIFSLVGANRMLPGKVTGITPKNGRECSVTGHAAHSLALSWTGGAACPTGGSGGPPDQNVFIMFGGSAKNGQEDLSWAQVKVHFRDPWHREANRYVMEIIVPLGMRLSIPHEAIIEEAGEKIVFVRNGENRCQRRAISVGIRGEIYDEILSGLQEGEEVATFGSFFLEAEYQLKRRSTRHHLGENH